MDNKDSEVETTDREGDTPAPEDGDDSDDITSQLTKVKSGAYSGQICTLKTLIDDDIVKIGDAVLSLEYQGKLFEADLLPSGCIRWTETKQIFSTPSSWVNHCKKVTNPEGPTGKASSAWSLIKHGGKRLDTYKLKWFRRQKKSAAAASQQQQLSNAASTNNSMSGDNIPSMFAGLPPGALSQIPSAMFKELQYSLPSTAIHDDDPEKMVIRNMVNYEQLSSRHPSNDQDMSVLVKCVPFSALDRIQPFTMTMSTNALLLIDFHCHLTSGEVTGYLGGSWDTSSHNLSILQAFPCRSRLADKERSAAVEEEIRQNLETRNLSVVGWYHSHPRSAAHPSVKDIDNQLEYQVVMKGETESNYVPCVGFICSPYDDFNPGPESSYQSFWVMPPNEYRPYEYGRPMQMLFSVTRDSFLTQDLLLEMRLLAHFYVGGPDAIKFNELFKSLDQKVDDLIDCLPSNGHDEQQSGMNNIHSNVPTAAGGDEGADGTNCNVNNKSNNEDGINQEEECEQQEKQTGSSQAALDGEKKELLDDEKNGTTSKDGQLVVLEEDKESGITYWEKLQGSLKPNLPRDLQSSDGQSAAQAQVQEQALAHFWAFLRGLLIPTATSTTTTTDS